MWKAIEIETKFIRTTNVNNDIIFEKTSPIDEVGDENFITQNITYYNSSDVGYITMKKMPMKELVFLGFGMEI